MTADAGRDSEPFQEEEEQECTTIQSACMQCFKNGETRLLLTKIPHFREVMLASFECPHCGETNNEVQFAGAYAVQGVRYRLEVPRGRPDVLSRQAVMCFARVAAELQATNFLQKAMSAEARRANSIQSCDGARQVVKSEHATARVPALEFEIPPGTQRGTITTVEGLLREAATGLAALQPQRLEADPATGAAVAAFLVRLAACADGEEAFALELEDPAGNSYVEAAGGDPAGDPLLTCAHFDRTPEQTEALGLLGGTAEGPGDEGQGGEIAPGDVHHGPKAVGAAAARAGLARLEGKDAEAFLSRYAAPEEVYELPSRCSACDAPCTSRAFATHIPFFKEVVLMADACDACGFRCAEVKGGGAVSDRGRRLALRVTTEADLRRDVIRAESATVSIPELELELSTGRLGGQVTTVEGLVATLAEALRATKGFQLGDSAEPSQRSVWSAFLGRLEGLKTLQEPWTLELRDPLANSFISGVSADAPQDDPALTIEDYERTAEEDETYGISALRELEKQEQGQGQVQGGGPAVHEQRPTGGLDPIAE